MASISGPLRSTSGTGAVGLLIADPQPVLAALLSRHFREALAPVAIASAASITEACRVLTGRGAWVVLTAGRLQDGTVFDLMRAVHENRCEARIVIWDDRLAQTMRCAEGVIALPRSLTINELDSRLRGLLANAPTDPFEPSYSLVPPADEPAPTSLSSRQMEILVLLAQGLSVKQIASRMDLTVKAVDSHKYRLMKQLQIHDRVDLVRWAIRSGLVEA